MASISDILLEQGRRAGDLRRQKANVWIPTIQQLSNLPGQVMQDRRADQERAVAQREQSQRMDLNDQRLAAGDRAEATENATTERQAHMRDVLATPGVIGEDGRFDVNAAQRVATEKGYRTVLPDVFKFGQEWNEGVDKGLLTKEQIADAKRPKVTQVDPTKDTYVDGVLTQSGVAPHEKITYGALTPVMVGGRRTLVRTGSDGKTYDIKNQVVTADVSPDVPPRADVKPSYEWAHDPATDKDVYATPDEIRAKGYQKIAGSGGLGGAAAETRNSRAAAALNSIEKLKTLAPVRTPGPKGIAEGAVEVGKGYLGYSTKTRQYQALIQPTAMQMAAAIQGAANLSDNERKAMAEMLGSISTMDYESQIALLENASDLIKNGADVQKVGNAWVPSGRKTRIAPGGADKLPAAPAGPQKIGRFDVVVDP